MVGASVLRLGLSGALILGAALVLASPAVAAPPALLSVEHLKRHPKATWTLAPGSEAVVVEVATALWTGSDGSFFTENIEAFDVLEPGQTTWLDSDPLKPGTYYVHVASFTPSCYPGCPLREWSQILPLVIRNQKPQISRLRVRYAGRYVIEGHATFRYCDDTRGYATGVILERYWLANIIRKSARHSDFFSVRAGCSTRTVSWYSPSRVFGVGWHSVRLQVRDDDGALSNRLSRRWYVSD